MKRFLLCLFLVTLFGCKEKEETIINYDDIIIVDNIAYLKHDMTLITGKVKDWHENGQLLLEWTFREGKKSVIWKGWFEDGQRWYDCTYNDNKLDGVFKWWYNTGQLKEEKEYNEGKKNGVHREWYENGELKSEETWKDDELISKKPTLYEVP